MSKDKFQVGDLVFWRDETEDDMGLVIEIGQWDHLTPIRKRVRILWFKSEDGVGNFEEGNRFLYTQQEWEELQNEQR
jgi:hypothetical protein